MRHTDMEFARRPYKHKPYTSLIVGFWLGQLHSHLDACRLCFAECFGIATVTFPLALDDMHLIQRPTHQE